MGRRWRIGRSCRMRQTFRIIGRARCSLRSSLKDLRLCRAANLRCRSQASVEASVLDGFWRLQVRSLFTQIHCRRIVTKIQSIGLWMFAAVEKVRRSTFTGGEFALSWLRSGLPSIYFEFDEPSVRSASSDVTIAGRLVDAVVCRNVVALSSNRHWLRLLPGQNP